MTFQWWRWRKPEDQWAIEANRFGSEVVEADSGIHAEDAETFAAEVVPDIGALEGIAQLGDAEAFAQIVAPDLEEEDRIERQNDGEIRARGNIAESDRASQLLQEGLIRGSGTDAPAAPAASARALTPDVREAGISAGLERSRVSPRFEPTPDARE